ncbi:hypothetical protein ACGFI9_09295 [Micromonospora sp. NPDC048930]|uniref:hypothetical protein n=1 Tax=Micromonospora sp. NPDC048930 TaxID=3364261 RepID=UPI003711DA3B
MCFDVALRPGRLPVALNGTVCLRQAEGGHHLADLSCGGVGDEEHVGSDAAAAEGLRPRVAVLWRPHGGSLPPYEGTGSQPRLAFVSGDAILPAG